MKRKKILIYQVGVIGDTIISLPVIREIVNRHSRDEVHIMNLHFEQKTFQMSLLEELPGNIASVRFEHFHSIKTVSGLISRIKLFLKIRREHYDTAYLIILYGVAKQLLYSFRFLTGIKHIFPTVFFREKHNNLLESLLIQFEGFGFSFDRNKKLLDYPLSQAHLEKADSYWKRLKIPENRIPVALCITAVTQAKFSWSCENYLELLKKAVPENQIFPVFLGAPEEKQLIQPLLDELQTGAFVSDLKAVELIALLKKCRFYLGNDTGPMHLADSAGIPCITLFSHRDYYKAWFPEGDHHITLIHPQPCGECHLQECTC